MMFVTSSVNTLHREFKKIKTFPIKSRDVSIILSVHIFMVFIISWLDFFILWHSEVIMDITNMI